MKVKNKNTLFISLLFFLITIGFFIGFILKDPYGDFMNEQKFKTLNSYKDANLVFYKKACPYCKAGKSEITNQAMKSKIVTYFIDADKKEGLEIAKKYHVKYAPTMVVIRNNDYKSFLYAHDKGKKIVVEKRKIKEAFEK
ncbi:thioredoxin family protein [Streptococcus parauberis]|uniref:Thioredoxin family protein n=1 Tax=Streptococcus parauberis TaxID=1348 RepID=A0AAE4HY07_9STRE|nr:thioredoxin family protein [Streptococcus parauberis]MDT2731545.1 thioredoxin family protein [Streptococcus parauberis]